MTSFKYSAGAAARTMPTYDDGSVNTLTADWHSPAIAVRTANTGANGIGITEDVAHTLDTTEPEAVAFAQNTRNEVRRIGGIGDHVGALTSNPDSKGQGQSLICQPIVCVADDTQNAAIDEDLCGTLKVGGDAVRSHVSMTGDFVGTLCAADGVHGVGNQYFMDGKVICQRMSEVDDEQ